MHSAANGAVNAQATTICNVSVWNSLASRRRAASSAFSWSFSTIRAYPALSIARAMASGSVTAGSQVTLSVPAA